MRLVIETIDEFVHFFFDGCATSFTQDDLDDEPEVVADHCVMVSYYQTLFENPRKFVTGHTRNQIDAGFAAMVDCNVPISLPGLVRDEAVPLNERKAVIGSIACLYERLFDADALFGTPFMFWDPIARDFEHVNDGRCDADTRQLQDAMFMSLCRILLLPSPKSQKAALHGLGHLRHPETAEVVQRYVAAHPDLPGDLRQYARQAVLGLIQ